MGGRQGSAFDGFLRQGNGETASLETEAYLLIQWIQSLHDFDPQYVIKGNKREYYIPYLLINQLIILSLKCFFFYISN